MDREGETVQILYIYSHSVRGTERFAKLFMYYDGRDRVRGKIDATGMRVHIFLLLLLLYRPPVADEQQISIDERIIIYAALPRLGY